MDSPRNPIALSALRFTAAIVVLSVWCCLVEAPSALEAKQAQPAAQTAKEISVELGKAKVSVDPSMELLEVVQYLADDPIIRKNSADAETAAYSRDIQKHFGELRQAPAVVLYRKMRVGGFAFGRVPELTVRMGPDLGLLTNSPGFAEYVRKSGATRSALIEFVEALASFRGASRFDAFFAAHESYYRSLVARVRSIIEKSGALSKLAGFYGYQQNSYQITLYPLANGGFAERIRGDNGRHAVYVFATVPADEAVFTGLLVHEIGHSYTGPLAYETHASALHQHHGLFAPIEASMKRQNYHSWINCVDEHVNRAVTAAILQQIHGGDTAQRELAKNKSRDFIYTEPIFNRLGDYQNQREKYPTFDAFYPEIVKLLGELD